MRPLSRGRGLAVRGEIGSFIRAVSVLRRAVRHQAAADAADRPAGTAEPSRTVYEEELDVLHVKSEVKRRVG